MPFDQVATLEVEQQDKAKSRLPWWAACRIRFAVLLAIGGLFVLASQAMVMAQNHAGNSRRSRLQDLGRRVLHHDLFGSQWLAIEDLVPVSRDLT